MKHLFTIDGVRWSLKKLSAFFSIFVVSPYLTAITNLAEHSLELIQIWLLYGSGALTVTALENYLKRVKEQSNGEPSQSNKVD